MTNAPKSFVGSLVVLDCIVLLVLHLCEEQRMEERCKRPFLAQLI